MKWQILVPEYLLRVWIGFLIRCLRQNKGEQVGLSSCKNIIEQHGGNISVKNTPTTFTIRMPNLLAKK
ncbi:hypothetical protein DSQ19_04805 [Candidatus Nitrosotenuis sp. DW1]|nr:hypothetical protein DSQ19_04805 [Candidatus Nitrosotenuis sp. DW1]